MLSIFYYKLQQLLL